MPIGLFGVTTGIVIEVPGRARGDENHIWKSRGQSTRGRDYPNFVLKSTHPP